MGRAAVGTSCDEPYRIWQFSACILPDAWLSTSVTPVEVLANLTRLDGRRCRSRPRLCIDMTVASSLNSPLASFSLCFKSGKSSLLSFCIQPYSQQMRQAPASCCRLYDSKYCNCLVLIAPRRRCRMSSTESRGDMPSSIKAIATNTGALFTLTPCVLENQQQFIINPKPKHTFFRE